MPISFGNKLVIAISSRALFNLDESHRIYEEQGLASYSEYQVEHEDEVLEPGEAFPLVKKLLRINEKLGGDPRVEVILLSRNSADTGLRVFNSIEHHQLNISRAAFCGGVVFKLLVQPLVGLWSYCRSQRPRSCDSSRRLYLRLC